MDQSFLNGRVDCLNPKTGKDQTFLLEESADSCKCFCCGCEKADHRSKTGSCKNTNRCSCDQFVPSEFRCANCRELYGRHKCSYGTGDYNGLMSALTVPESIRLCDPSVTTRIHKLLKESLKNPEGLLRNLEEYNMSNPVRQQRNTAKTDNGQASQDMPGKEKSGWTRCDMSDSTLVGGPGLRGLANFGNVCYLNSVLQCLIHLNGLRSYFASMRDAKLKDKPLATAFVKLLDDLYDSRKNGNKLDCSGVKREMGNIDPIFHGTSQQDAYETMTLFLSSLHEELINELSSQALELFDNAPNFEREWQKYRNKNNSKITDLFYCLQITHIACSSSEAPSKASSQPISTLMISIPKDQEDYAVKLSDQIGKYFRKPHRHDPNFMFKCDLGERCKYLPVSLWNPPPIVIVYLKRFYKPPMSQVQKKTMCPVILDEDLDLKTYIYPKSPHAGASANYELAGIICHHGSLHSGHYYCYVKNGTSKKWYLLDDEAVRPLGKEINSEELTKTALILFFEKKKH